MNTQKGAIGAQQQGNVTHGVMPEQIVKELQSAASAGPGTDFLVIQRVRQGEEPRIWSTGDPEQTKDLFRTAYTSLAYDKEFERT
jgi:hypothetical protein